MRSLAPRASAIPPASPPTPPPTMSARTSRPVSGAPHAAATPTSAAMAPTMPREAAPRRSMGFGHGGDGGQGGCSGSSRSRPPSSVCGRGTFTRCRLNGSGFLNTLPPRPGSATYYVALGPEVRFCQSVLRLYLTMGIFRPIFLPVSIASSYPASACLTTPMPGSVWSTLESLQSAS